MAVLQFAVRSSAETPQVGPNRGHSRANRSASGCRHTGVGNTRRELRNERITRTVIIECQSRHVADVLSLARRQTYSTNEQDEQDVPEWR